MPRYDYCCKTCGHQFELKQSFFSDPVATCPKCHNGAQRMFSAVPVVFKGSGFYVNDYGKGKGAATSTVESKNAGSEKDSKATSKAETGAGAKGESKKELAPSK